VEVASRQPNLCDHKRPAAPVNLRTPFARFGFTQAASRFRVIQMPVFPASVPSSGHREAQRQLDGESLYTTFPPNFSFRSAAFAAAKTAWGTGLRNGSGARHECSLGPGLHRGYAVEEIA
jgi:hypothetical protein